MFLIYTKFIHGWIAPYFRPLYEKFFPGQQIEAASTSQKEPGTSGEGLKDEARSETGASEVAVESDKKND